MTPHPDTKTPPPKEPKNMLLWPHKPVPAQCHTGAASRDHRVRLVLACAAARLWQQRRSYSHSRACCDCMARRGPPQESSPPRAGITSCCCLTSPSSLVAAVGSAAAWVTISRLWLCGLEVPPVAYLYDTSATPCRHCVVPLPPHATTSDWLRVLPLLLLLLLLLLPEPTTAGSGCAA